MNAYDKATNLLKIRPHFSGELAKKLSLRGFEKQDIDEVINRLTGEGLLNDELFVQIFLENLIKYKTFGHYGLKVKLMQRGIDGNDAENLLVANFPPSREYEVAKKLLDRWSNLPQEKIAQRLSSKGFRSEVIREVISKQ